MFCIASSGMDRVPVDCQAPDALIVIDRVELAHLSPFYLDSESAVAISGAILMLWAVAYLLRMARKTIENSSESES